MKYILFAVFALYLTAEAASNIPLPRIIATVDGVAISSDKIRQEWENISSKLPENVPQEAVERLFQKLTENYIWQREINLLLSEKGIPVNRSSAEKYLIQQQNKYPSEFQKLSQEKIKKMLNSPEIHLKGAVYIYLQTEYPEKISVSNAEIEYVYRSNPEKFRTKGKELWGIIEVKDRETAESARALLIQGSGFDAVAGEYSIRKEETGVLPDNLPELAKKMKVKEISPVIKGAKSYFILKLRSRRKDTIQPLEKVRSAIKMELESAKAGAVLSMLLKSRLAGKQIIYHRLTQ